MNLRHRPNVISLAAMLAAVSAPDFAKRLTEDSEATNLHVIRLREGMAVATYENNTTNETVRIFVRDAGVIARDLPGEGPTKFHLKRIEPVSHGFLSWYADGRQWPDIRREYYRPEPWEVIAWKWPKAAAESIQAGSLVLREIGKVTCRECGKPEHHHAVDETGKCPACVLATYTVMPGKWNGQPCKATRGTVLVGVVEKVTWWCYGMTGHRRRCVRVEAPGEPAFFIDDVDGRGTLKVYHQGGGPGSYHASIPVDDAESFERIDDGPVDTVVKPTTADVLANVAKAKVGRNDLCPCGSGQKSKKCCG